MKIGNLELKNNVFLAPMAGVTDRAFRIICAEKGCALAYTEMVSAKGLFYESKNTFNLLKIDGEESTAVQLFGSDPKIMAEMAKKIQDYPISLFDINMGCPAPKIVKNGEGCALMLNPQRVGEIVYAVSCAVDKPVTVKIRKGFNDESVNADEIAEIAEKNGAAAVAVHGRTRQQYYSGAADWDIIKKVKRKVKIPVIGNGDITTPQSAKKMLDYTGCDAVMIGRGAQGNPWIFSRILKYLNDGVLLPEPSFGERLSLALRHLDMLIEDKGEFIGIREMRKHLSWYTKGMPNSAELRVSANKTQSAQSLKQLLISFADTLQ